MFQFGRFPTYTYVFSIRFTVLHRECFHIRISADRSLFAAPRSFSQLVTSFIGSWCQGIHLMLLFTWTFLLVLIMFLELLEFLNIYFGLLIHLWKGFILLLESSSTFRWNCNLPKLERPINSTSDLVKIICPLICSFLTLQYTLFGFQWSLFLLPYLFKSMMQRWCKNFATQNFWWAQVDSNHRPRAYQARALTTWAMSPFSFSVYLVLSRRLCPLTLTYAR